MKPYVEERVINVARYLVEHKSTIRATAKKFGVSKSTIAVDLHTRLAEIDKDLYLECQEQLQTNIAERHLRGGYATRERWANYAGKERVTTYTGRRF